MSPSISSSEDVRRRDLEWDLGVTCRTWCKAAMDAASPPRPCVAAIEARGCLPTATRLGVGLAGNMAFTGNFHECSHCERGRWLPPAVQQWCP